MAAQACGLDTIEAEIRHGTAHDALRYAVTVEAKQNGLSQQISSDGSDCHQPVAGVRDRAWFAWTGMITGSWVLG